MTTRMNMVGKRYGHLTVLTMLEEKTKSGQKKVLALCDCGRETVAAGYALRNGGTKSCGCLKNAGHPKHGQSRPDAPHYPEFTAWQQMIKRCTNPKCKGFYRYGGRGIQVHEQWSTSFENFLKDVGPKPTPKHTLERIDRQGNYEPSNVKWATWTEQGRNKCNNRLITVDGITDCVSATAERLGLNRHRIHDHIGKLGRTAQEAADFLRTRTCVK